MSNETNVINWKDAFKDEGFLSELKKFIDQCFEDNTATDEDIDDITTVPLKWTNLSLK